jgi:hypothetical protein
MSSPLEGANGGRPWTAYVIPESKSMIERAAIGYAGGAAVAQKFGCQWTRFSEDDLAEVLTLSEGNADAAFRLACELVSENWESVEILANSLARDQNNR